MANFGNWKHKAQGIFQKKPVFLFGSIHHQSYVPLVEEAIRNFSPDLILLECDSDTSSMTPDMLFAYLHSKKEKIRVAFFDYDLTNVLHDIAQKCSVVDSFVLFAFHALSDILNRKYHRQIGGNLVAALKNGDRSEVDFALKLLFPEILTYFREHIFKFSPKEFDLILDSEKLKTYRLAFVKRSPGMYKELTKASPEIALEMPFYRSEHASEFFEKPECVSAHMREREEKMFENINTAFQKNTRTSRVLIVTGVDHFEFLKGKLGI